MKHNKLSKKEGLRQALDLLNLVGIPNAEKRLKKLSASIFRGTTATDRHCHRINLLSTDPDC